MEMRKPVSSMAQLARFSPKVLNMPLARLWAPPECSIICPKIAPSPMMVAMNPSAPPIPSLMVSPTSMSSIVPELIPTKMAARSRLTKACTRKARIRTRMRTMDRTRTETRRKVSYSAPAAVCARMEKALSPMMDGRLGVNPTRRQGGSSEAFRFSGPQKSARIRTPASRGRRSDRRRPRAVEEGSSWSSGRSSWPGTGSGRTR